MKSVVTRPSALWGLSIVAVISAPAWSAETGDCASTVRIARMGVPLVADNRRTMMQSVGSYHYKVYAKVEDRRCANVTFNIAVHTIDMQGRPASASYPLSIRFFGGHGEESGQVPGRKEDREVHLEVEDISCKRC